VNLLSEISFAAALVYSPRGSSVESRLSREGIRNPLKRGDPTFIESVQLHLRDSLLRSSHSAIVAEFLDQEATLVPVPGSAPLQSSTALWPSAVLSDALVKGGLGHQVMPLVRRVSPVPKSAFAKAGDRPTPESHFTSMTVDQELRDPPARVTLVDDIVTRGATLIAAASRLKEAFPRSEIRAFALVRTMGLVHDIEKRWAPCVGRITYDGHNLDRQP